MICELVGLASIPRYALYVNQVNAQLINVDEDTPGTLDRALHD
jgi:hypothetical protein